MPVLTIIYARGSNIVSRAIKAFDPFGKWSHCGVVTERGSVVESRMLHGVVETESADFMARYPGFGATSAIDIQCPDPQAGIAWARSRIGNGYDYGAVLGMLLRIKSADRTHDNCVEIAEGALAAAGRSRLREAPWRITPNVSWMIK